jgi:hypothetical protein
VDHGNGERAGDALEPYKGSVMGFAVMGWPCCYTDPLLVGCSPIHNGEPVAEISEMVSEMLGVRWLQSSVMDD